MQLIDGKQLAQKTRARIKERVALLSEVPGLAILLVGDDPASHVYVNLKQKACEEVGIHFEKFLYATDVSTEELIKKVQDLNERPDIHGVLVQLPLPTQDEDAVIAAINPNKDVDGFHAENQKKLETGLPCLAPATALSIMKLIDATHSDLHEKRAAVIGSELFTRPLRHLLSEQGVRTDRLDPLDLELGTKTRTYDILVPVVGHPGILTNSMIKDGALVIDVGTTRHDGKIKGDVDPTGLDQKTGWLSPVPGGVGPMTVAMLLVNVLKAYQFSKQG